MTFCVRISLRSARLGAALGVARSSAAVGRSGLIAFFIILKCKILCVVGYKYQIFCLNLHIEY